MREDERYIINLCDSILSKKAIRQHRFDFLKGDSGRKLPVDAYYPDLNLVIEFHEIQHTEAVPFFDRKATVSDVPRGEQRRIYDQRRREILPRHGIILIEFSVTDFPHKSRKKLLRILKEDREIIRNKLRKAKIV
jgi:hypothetical protein